MGERITSREMRDVRYGLVRHGLLLLPSEIVGDFDGRPRSRRYWDDQSQNLIPDEYPMSLVDMMLNSVRLFGERNCSNFHEGQTQRPDRPDEHPMTSAGPAENESKSLRSPTNANVSSSPANAADVRIILFAVLQGTIEKPGDQKIDVNLCVTTC